jgi:glutaredoxin
MDELRLAKLLLTVTHNDLEQLEGTVLATPACSPLPRVRAAVLGENWTAPEENHKQSCPYCQRTAGRVQSAAWHPTLVELFAHGSAPQKDLAYHLERDDCKHCQRVREALAGNRVVGRLTTASDHGPLKEFLQNGVAGKVVELESGKETRLVQVVVGRSEQFVLLRAGEKASFSGLVVTVFDVRASVLAAEDLPLLREASKNKELAWNDWAARALRGTELDGKVREGLMQIVGKAQLR